MFSGLMRFISSLGRRLGSGSGPHEVLVRLTRGSIARVSYVFLLAIFLGGRPADSVPGGHLEPREEVRHGVRSA
jgi:hypothetical protein